MTDITPQTVELSFKKFKDLTVEKLDKLQRATFLTIAARVIDKTPVKTGRARSAWIGDVGKFNSSKPRVSKKEISPRKLQKNLLAPH